MTPAGGDAPPGLPSKSDNIFFAALSFLLDLLGIGVSHPMHPCADVRVSMLAPSVEKRFDRLKMRVE